jgi:hypothetical protein
VSRAVAMVVYLRQLGWVALDPGWDEYLNLASKGILYASGIGTAALILTFVMRAYVQRRRVHASIAIGRHTPPTITGQMTRREA